MPPRLLVTRNRAAFVKSKHNANDPRIYLFSMHFQQALYVSIYIWPRINVKLKLAAIANLDA